jgi:hypothetical protein
LESLSDEPARTRDQEDFMTMQSCVAWREGFFNSIAESSSALERKRPEAHEETKENQVRADDLVCRAVFLPCVEMATSP